MITRHSLAIHIICSERLSGKAYQVNTYTYKKYDGSSFTQVTNVTRFLYYFSRICLCKSIKELFLMRFRKRCSLKAGAKLRTFLIPTKYFEEKIVFILHFIFLFDINQPEFFLHIII